jgi:phage tail sheath protein FI
MPEYLAPGVYVEEVDTGAKPIEGVSVSTTGMVGVTERGPVGKPTFVIGFADFTRQFGGFLNRRQFTGPNWLLPHAVDGFFTNGGKRLFLVRVLPDEATYAELLLYGAVPGGFAGALAGLARRGERFLLVDDPTGLAAGDTVLVGDGVRTEYVAAADADVVALRNPLPAAQPAGIAVVPYTIGDPQPPVGSTTISAPGANQGASEITLDDLAGLAIAGGEVLRIGTAGTWEYVVTAAVDAGPPVVVTLDAPLQLDHPTGEPVDRLAVAARLSQRVEAGALELRPDNATGLAAAGGDTLWVGAGAAGEYVVTAGVDAGPPVVVTLDAPVQLDHEAGELVVLVDATAAPGTELVHDAELGDRLLLVGDGSALVGAQALAFGTEPPTFNAAPGDLGAVGVDLGPALRHPAGMPVVKPTLASLPDRALTSDAEAGDTVIELAKRDDLAEQTLLLLTGGAGSEYVAIEELDPTPGATADNPGRVTLGRPLRLPYAAGETAAPRNDQAADQDATVLAHDAAAGDTALLLADASGYGPTDTIRLEAADSARREYLTLVDSDAAPVALAAPLRESHAAGVALTERRPVLRVRAIDRGAWGNCLRVTAEREDAPTLDTTTPGAAAGSPTLELATAVGLEPGGLLELYTRNPDRTETVQFRQKVAAVSGNVVTFGPGGLEELVAEGTRVRTAEFKLTVECIRTNPRTRRDFVDPTMSETLRNLGFDPRQSRYVERVIGAIPAVDERGEGESGLIRVEDLFSEADAVASERTWPDLLTQTTPEGERRPFGLRLEGGNDRLDLVTDDTVIGTDAVDPADRTGLHALKSVDEISMVAAPGRTSGRVQQALLTHCELMRFRIAVLDSRRGAEPRGLRVEEVQAQRSLYDSKYGALYYPWLVIDDPFPNNPSVPEPVWIPPSGHVLGIYARKDVHQAPANETIGGVNDLQVKLVKEQQDLLNPRNINALRNFRDRGRGLRVWGARCVTSDPDWKYVNVRRLFNYLEASIERGTQWVVFEPNDYRLWARVTQSVSAFLSAVWRDGALMGRTAEQAFYVKCDETTMTQFDIDNGRLIMLIGVAPVKPAEFVIIRIGQWAGGSMVQEA